MVIGVLHGMKVKCQLLRRNFFFSFSAYRRAVWHEGEVKLNASDMQASPCASNFFSFMQEITLYFLRQNKLGFILT